MYNKSVRAGLSYVSPLTCWPQAAGREVPVLQLISCLGVLSQIHPTSFSSLPTAFSQMPLLHVYVSHLSQSKVSPPLSLELGQTQMEEMEGFVHAENTF